MRKVIALDIGGVVFEPRWRLYGVDEVSKKLGITKEKFKSALVVHKKDFYTGKITEKEYWNNVLSELKIETAEDLAKLYRSYVTLNQEIIPILQRLSEQHILVACNNCPKEWMDYRIKLANLSNYFSKFITSGYVGYMKPDTRIYQLLKNSFPEQEIIYIDDDHTYVEAAKSLGMNAIHFQSSSDLRDLYSI